MYASGEKYERKVGTDMGNKQHHGQTFARARVLVRAEVSARTKTEEKYISAWAPS